MPAPSPRRWLVTAGLVTWLVVGVPAWRRLAEQPSELVAVLPWFVAYAAFGLGFWISTLRAQTRPAMRRGALAIQSVAALVACAGPRFSLAPALLVVVAGQAPAMLAPVRAVAWVAVQSAVLLAIGGATGEAPFSSAPYVAFELFALAASHFARAEASARHTLALANAELAIARAQEAAARGTVERLRLSRELHDSVGHHLTALSLELELAINVTGEPLAASVRRARTLVRDLLGEVRSVVSGLREATPFDLRSALEALAAGVATPRIHLTVPDERWTDDVAGRAMFRCAQEAVTNAVRHAAAGNVWLDLARVNDAWILRARDDGRGSAELRRGNGLTGLAERFAELGGALEIDASPGGGYTLRASLPRTPTS